MVRQHGAGSLYIMSPAVGKDPERLHNTKVPAIYKRLEKRGASEMKEVGSSSFAGSVMLAFRRIVYGKPVWAVTAACITFRASV